MRASIGIVLILVLLNSCKKDTPDFRDKYIGHWEFDVEKTTFHLSDSLAYSYDTLTYFGEIVHGIQDDELFIRYTISDSITLKINVDGEFSGFPTHYCSGRFEGDNIIHLYLQWGGLGGGTKHNIVGDKK